eukprot:3210777-Rhodomonas_salina.3
MLVMLVMLWTNAVYFTCHFWTRKAALKSLYITTRAIAMLSQRQRTTGSDLCQTVLVDGTILYLMLTLVAPKLILNSIMMEALDRMFGAATESERKPPLTARHGAPWADLPGYR